MIKDQLFIRGAVLGLLIPSIAFMIYSLVRMDGDFVALYYELNALNIHTHVMSLCVLTNAIPFFIFIKSCLPHSPPGFEKQSIELPFKLLSILNSIIGFLLSVINISTGKKFSISSE